MAAIIKVNKVPIPIPIAWYKNFDVGGAAESKYK